MAASVCVETALSILLRLLFKDVLLRNNNNNNKIKSNIKITNSSLFIVQIFMGTSYSFTISKTAVYLCPFKTNDVKTKIKKNVIAW